VRARWRRTTTRGRQILEAHDNEEEYVSANMAIHPASRDDGGFGALDRVVVSAHAKGIRGRVGGGVLEHSQHG
jgi:hypothetical protein